jgi:hypothetical protein
MSIEAMKQALEALEEACGDRCNAEYNPCHARTAIASLRQAIDKAEKREPKKWVEVECPLCGEMAVAHTHPNLNKREWIGLTDAEIEEFDYYARDLVMDIEKALKERNNVA